AVVYHENGQRVGTADDDDCIAAATLAGERKAAARKRIVQAIGQRTPTDHREFRGRGERGPDERAERENEWSFTREGTDRGTSFIEQKPGSKPAAADIPAQQRLGQRHAVRTARRDIDAKVTTVVAGRHHFN